MTFTTKLMTYSIIVHNARIDIYFLAVFNRIGAAVSFVVAVNIRTVGEVVGYVNRDIEIGEGDDDVEMGEIDDDFEMGEADEDVDMGEADKDIDMGEADKDIDMREADEDIDMGDDEA